LNKQIPLGSLKVEQMESKLTKQEQMKPYIDFWEAEGRADEDAVQRALEKIRSLPLEERYAARIVHALEWAFSDFDSETLKVDVRLGFNRKSIQKLDKSFDDRRLQIRQFFETIENSR